MGEHLVGVGGIRHGLSIDNRDVLGSNGLSAKGAYLPWSVCGQLWVVVVGGNLKSKTKTKCLINVDTRQSSKSFTFLHSWKMAKAMDTTNEKKDSCRALKALSPSTPRANGIRVIAFSNTNTMIGMTIFFNLDLRAEELSQLNKHNMLPNLIAITFNGTSSLGRELDLQAQLIIVDVLW